MRATQPPLPTGVRALPRVATCLLTAIAALSCTESAPTTVTQNPDAPPPTRGVTVRESRGPAFVPGRILVQFESGVDEAGRGSIAALQGGAVGRAIASARSGRSIGTLVSVPAGREVAAAAALSRQPGVVFAEPDWVRTIAPVAVNCDPCLTPDDPHFESKWDLHNDGSVPGLFGPTATGGEDADMDWLEAFDHLGPDFDGNALIGIIDTGIRSSHEDICGKVAAARNFITDQDGGTDDHGHGSHVAGIAAACANNSRGVAGVGYAPNIRLLAAKVCDAAGNCASSDVAEAMMWVADMGANVMNLSLGDTVYSATEHAALQYAASAGVLPVCAAGNDGTDRVLWPAANAECIAVTATDWGDDLASYSTFGPEAELAAPGGDTEDFFLGTSFILSLGIGSDGDYVGNVGTSMATPQVAGLAGLLFALGIPTAADVRDRMRTSADDLGPTGWDDRYGHGRINVFNAVSGFAGGARAPSAEFTFTPSLPQPGQGVSFDATTSSDPDGTVVSWEWDFGDGSAAGSGETVSHAYATEGSFAVTLTVTDDEGQTDAASRVVVVSADPAPGTTPVLHLSASSITGIGHGQAVATWTDPQTGRTVSAPTSTNRATYLTGQTPTGSPAVRFDGNDYYQIADEAALELDGSSTVIAVYRVDGLSDQILVSKHSDSDAPGALVSGIQSDGRLWTDRPWLQSGPRSSTAIGTGSYRVLAYRISGTSVDFRVDRAPAGTGSMNAGVATNRPLRIGAVRHRSTQVLELFLEGRLVELMVFNQGLSDSDLFAWENRLYEQHLSPGPNLGPTASFTFSPPAPVAGQSVAFNGGGSSDPDGTIASWEWNWGDGSPGGTGAAASHPFASEGQYTVTLTVTDDRGGTDQTSQVVDVEEAPNQAPSASFVYSPFGPEPGATVSFDASASSDVDGTIAGYAWDWGDGTPSGAGATADHAFSTAGSYVVTLTVTDDEGASGTAAKTVVVADAGSLLQPTLRLSAAEIAGVASGGAVAQWEDPRTGRAGIAPLASNAATFLTGQTPTGSPAVHFQGNDYYEVADEAALEMNASSTVILVLSMDANNVQQAFVTKNHFGLSGGAYIAGMLSNGALFLDRPWIQSGPRSTTALGTGQFQLVTYRISGTSAVERIDRVQVGGGGLGSGAATDQPLRIGILKQESAFDNGLRGKVAEVLVFNTGLSDADLFAWEEYLETVHITGTPPPPPPNEAPTASFGFTPNAPETGETVSFDGSGSSDSDGTIASYAWNWGDGSPAGSGSTATHEYSAAGDYTVTLTVTDDDGATDQTSQVVSVTDPPPPPNEAPTASFTFSPASPETGETVGFDGGPSTDSDGTIAAWSWDFGDGSPAGSGPTSTHSYAAAGDYTVTLVVTDDDGATGEASQVVSVSDPPPPPNESPTASFGFSPASPATGETVSFDATGSSDSDGTIASYAWDWGDGSAAGSGATPTHVYGAAGDYTVALTVTDDDGVTDQASQVVSVSDPPPPPNEAPVASFTFSPASPESGETVSFDGTGSSDSDGTIASYAWNWGDGSPAGSGSTPTHAYSAAGDYTVTLTVTDDDGATGQSSQVVSVSAPPPPPNEAPTASFSVSCAQNDCTFTDLSTDADGTVVAWTWDFGDGRGDTVQSPSYTYRHAGTYTVLLSIQDDDGAGDSTSQTLAITCTTRGNGTRCR